MESPFNRPVACNMIRNALDNWNDDQADYPYLCGWSIEMRIYDALLKAGYLTEEATIKADDEPKPSAEPKDFIGDFERDQINQLNSPTDFFDYVMKKIKEERDKWK